jgi:DNA-directed RNA polymerase I, II, and III subunit RPABC2
MDEFAPDVDEDVVLEEEYEAEEGLEVEEEEQTEQQRAEAADVVKLFKQHPEIWIPYKEQVQEQLNVHAPEVGAPPTPGSQILIGMNTSLRNTSILDKHHQTYPFLTNYEKTKCISFRASQINHGAKPYLLVPTGMNDSYQIAKMELEQKRLPYILKRPLPDGNYEVWRLADLMIV